jgi:Fe-S oxidoreductase
VLRSRVFVALHMHAGDGNVHTNLPVNSDDYGMLKEAEAAVARIMALARSLDGVISGEHGIGITKLEFLTEGRRLADFRAYKQRIDPEGRFNKGKLLAGGDLRNAYTPSFGLMGAESLILQASDIGAIADSVKNCLRCGKCKPVCSTHVPRANLLYSPRNKILATSLLVEAFLYEEQTRRGVSIKHWDEFSDVADHCTVCHKCETPCPVDIDFGDVSMNMRNLLRKMGKKKFNRRQCGGDVLPERQGSRHDQRHPLGDGRPRLQARSASPTTCFSKLARRQTDKPPATVGKAPVKSQVIHFINKKMPGNLPKKTARALLDIEDARYVPIIRDPQATTVDSRGGVLFSGLRVGASVLAGRAGHAGDALAGGCADGAAAGLSVLRLSAARLGPVRQSRADHHRQPGAVPSGGQHPELPRHQDRGGQLRHLLRPVAELRVREGVPGLPDHRHPRVPDGKGRRLEGVTGTRYMYHEPCHTPMKTYASSKVVNTLMNEELNGRVDKNDRCCGESGTLAVSRPDISTQVRFRKEEEMRRGADALRALPVKAASAASVPARPSARSLRRPGQDPHLLPVLPAGAVALRGRHRRASRLHRGRDGPSPARRGLDGGLRPAGQRRRHRAGAGVRLVGGGGRTVGSAPPDPLEPR